MEALKIRVADKGVAFDTMEVTGFTDSELAELGSMSRSDLNDAVIGILDERNQKTGTCWACGYGIYDVAVCGGAVYLKVGNTCD